MRANIDLLEYDYFLDENKIAKYPLRERDASKLLCYRDKKVEEFIFKDLDKLLPDNAMLVFNNTKVVPARMLFKKDSGALIEVFCLEPLLPSEYNKAFVQKGTSRWKCIVGNAKKWKEDFLSLYNPSNNTCIKKLNLRAKLIDKDEITFAIEFHWNSSYTFSEVLHICGNIPIPPYLNRDSEDIDSERYQTLYAKFEGSVAAPTAGLHFTEELINRLKTKGIRMESVCLHVGAGTFLPIKGDDINKHSMHREQFSVSLAFLKKIRQELGKTKIVAVGTTSVRTLESLYYIGVSIIENQTITDVGQWCPYDREYNYTRQESLEAIIEYLEKNELEDLTIGTNIIIVPGFYFRLVDILITNFHQAKSTLILLVSAFISGDWKILYEYALSHNFRFLSYGDSSLLFRE